MKHLIFIFALASLAACSKPAADPAAHHERPPENGAQYKDREGVALTPVMKRSIGLQTAEVAEAKIAPEFTVELSVVAELAGFQKISLVATSRVAIGWLTAEQAAVAKVGMEAELRERATTERIATAGVARGVVKRVERAPYQTSGDFEVTIEADAPAEIGTRLFASFHAPAGELVATVPRAAILKTAEGNFVYAVNGERYVRTPVKVGAQSRETVEITDGLYAGDEVVVAGVTPLWLAELQVLRGGKACTCGH